MRIFASVLAGMGGAFIVYLLGCFIGWDFNPGNWDSFGRAFIGFFMVWVGAIAAFIVGGWLEQ